MRLIRRPRKPTIKIKLGSCMSSGIRNLLTDSMRIEKHKAHKNTELTKAPRTSALAQPNVFLDHRLVDILTLINAMTRAITSLNMWNESATRAMEFVM